MVGKNTTNRPTYLTAIKLRKGENKQTDDGLTMFWNWKQKGSYNLQHFLQRIGRSEGAEDRGTK